MLLLEGDLERVFSSHYPRTGEIAVVKYVGVAVCEAQELIHKHRAVHILEEVAMDHNIRQRRIDVCVD
ncbi:MAG: hypothetical protein BWY82_01835 [Verrucomicrobia bacterium ADurb.Bin474]|nr:MAG: hypothetical protein BWY82_01835 [Verrucomicrobia bacterium ADurb.Bin474]